MTIGDDDGGEESAGAAIILVNVAVVKTLVI